MTISIRMNLVSDAECLAVDILEGAGTKEDIARQVRYWWVKHNGQWRMIAREDPEEGSTMLTDAELKAMRERCEKAAPGPWYYSDICGDQETAQVCYKHHGVKFSAAGDIMPIVNAAFIAHARADVPKLLEEVERLRQCRRIF